MGQRADNALPPGPVLNEAQVRHLLATLAYVDESLRHIEDLCSGRSSPFGRERFDLAPGEAHLLASFVDAARSLMLEACDRLGVERPRPTVSARWAIETALHFAAIAFADASDTTMRKYGPLSPVTADDLAKISDALDALMQRGIALIQRSYANLTTDAETVPGEAGRILREVARLTVQHGLHEVRPQLAAAIEKARTETLDVGIFGRVSSGKSSLIDAIVGGPVLPVGPTPVTPVPVVVEQGAEGIEVRFASGKTQQGALEELHTFVTEATNPENARGVLDVRVRVPLAPPGFRLLDTPGVGTLSTTGPALAFATLPRCDVGVVLIATGTAVAPDDLALLQTLRVMGIDAMVLVSKADLVPHDERERVIRYVESQLQRSLGPSHGIEVRPISVHAENDVCVQTFWRAIEKRAQDKRKLGESALAGRLSNLVAVTAAALAGRGTTLTEHMNREQVRRSAAQGLRSVSERLARSGPTVLDRVIESVAAEWRDRGDASAAVKSAVLAPAVDALAQARSILENACARLGATQPAETFPPQFCPGFLNRLPDLSRAPVGSSLLGRRMARRRLSGFAADLDHSLAQYASRLLTWGEASLQESVRSVSASSSVAPERRDLASLLSELRGWGLAGSAPTVGADGTDALGVGGGISTGPECAT